MNDNTTINTRCLKRFKELTQEAHLRYETQTDEKISFNDFVLIAIGLFASEHLALKEAEEMNDLLNDMI